MLEMLREGLNQHDRIPNDGPGFEVAGWVRHIVAHYHKLPDLIFFAKPDVPSDSRVFLREGKGSIQEALGEYAAYRPHPAPPPPAVPVTSPGRFSTSPVPVSPPGRPTFRCGARTSSSCPRRCMARGAPRCGR